MMGYRLGLMNEQLGLARVAVPFQSKWGDVTVLQSTFRWRSRNLIQLYTPSNVNEERVPEGLTLDMIVRS